MTEMDLVFGTRRAWQCEATDEEFALDVGDDAAVLPWQEQALCAQTDPEAFFPEKGGSTREAKRVCSRCEVRADCNAQLAAWIFYGALEEILTAWVLGQLAGDVEDVDRAVRTVVDVAGRGLAA